VKHQLQRATVWLPVGEWAVLISQTIYNICVEKRLSSNAVFAVCVLYRKRWKHRSGHLSELLLKIFSLF